MNYYPFNIGDYMAHTAHLTDFEDLAFRRLIDRYHLSEAPLRGDPKQLARLVNLRDHVEEVATVLEEFFTPTPEGWVNKRCQENLEDYFEAQEQVMANDASEKARKARYRARRQELFDALQARGIRAAWNAKIADLERLLSQPSDAPGTDQSHDGDALGTGCGHQEDAPITDQAHTEDGPGTDLERTEDAPSTAIERDKSQEIRTKSLTTTAHEREGTHEPPWWQDDPDRVAAEMGRVLSLFPSSWGGDDLTADEPSVRRLAATAREWAAKLGEEADQAILSSLAMFEDTNGEVIRTQKVKGHSVKPWVAQLRSWFEGGRDRWKPAAVVLPFHPRESKADRREREIREAFN